VLGNPDPEPFLMALREGLQKIGYIEGQNIRFELRSARGNRSLLRNAAAELVTLKVDIMVAWQTVATQVAKQATNDIPIVMVGVGVDPVEAGFIASLARPGGNITGISSAGPPFAGKIIDLIRELLPSVRRVAVLANSASPFAKQFLAQIEVAARTVSLDIEPIMLSEGEEFDAAFAEMRSKRVEAIIIQPGVLRKAAVDLALKHRLPSFSVIRQLPETGGLISYHPILTAELDEAALYIDKILKGSKPADLPVAQPSKFALVINLKTAKALGITIPPSLLTRADEVIE
jgi:putative ABC transport system substrate-binding protein